MLETLLDTTCPIEEFRAALPLANEGQLKIAALQLLDDADRGDEESSTRHRELLDYYEKHHAPRNAPPPITGGMADDIRAKMKAAKAKKATTELATIPGEITDAEMGAQLLAQYGKVKTAILDVVIFGGMLLQVQEILSKRVNSKHARSGRFEKGTGFQIWLETYAKDISKPTAYKYIRLAEGIREEFRLTAKTDLVKLLSTPIDELPKGEKSTREKIEKFVEGKTQRQLEFSFGTTDSAKKGGKKDKQGPEPTPDEILAQKKQDANDSYEHIVKLMDTFFANNDHTLLDADRRKLFAATLGTAKTKVEAVA